MQISDFPIFQATIPEGKFERVAEAIRILSDAVEAGEIANVVYNDKVKFPLGNAFDNAWDAAVQKPFTYNRDYAMSDAEREIYYSLNGHPMAHTVKTFITRIEKPGIDSDFTRAALDLLAELKVIGDAIVGLKGKVVKRQPKPPEDLKARYSAPDASRRAIGQVRDILIGITDKAFQALLNHLQSDYVNRVAAYVERINAQWEKRPSKDQTFTREERKDWQDAEARITAVLPYGSLLSAVETIESESNYRLGVTFKRVTLKADAVAITEAFALKDAEQTRDNFIYKNLVKLDSVLEAKGDFAGIEVVGYEVSLGSLEGTLRLTFKDGAAFTVTNKVVGVVNSHGTSFDRFPLTFHNVFLGNGSKMGRPSEERMNTVFVGKGEAA